MEIFNHIIRFEVLKWARVHCVFFDRIIETECQVCSSYTEKIDLESYYHKNNFCD